MLNDAKEPAQAAKANVSLDGGRLPAEVVGRCFHGLESASGLLLAVSGGPDSMALLLMAAVWVDDLGLGAPEVHVATVDHSLRPDSQREAALVAKVAADHGLPHATLVWMGPKLSTRVQERARAARYALLADYARVVGASHILTAHHADDQAETILLRLARGSGIAGLAGIRRLSALAPDLSLVRPFLEITKAQLVAHCRAELCDFVEDPSNSDPRFARARLRAQGSALKVLGLDQPGLVRLARRMARADIALEREVDRVEAIFAPNRADRTYRVDLMPARALPREIAVRLLGRAVVHVTAADIVADRRALRLERLETLTDAIWTALEAGRPHRATLAGTQVSLDLDGTLSVSVERPRRRGRRDAAEAVLRPN